jgi:hypothetical protein
MLDAAVEDVRCANGVLGGVVQDLAREARDIDSDLLSGWEEGEPC